jgi:hypothetical protein
MGELRVALHAGQLAIHRSKARFKVCAAGRRFGKSHLAAAELLIAGLASEQNGHELDETHEVYYIAPTFEQGKRIMWAKLKKLGGFAEEGGVIAARHENTGVITLINGRKISIKGADNPDSLRGVGLSYVVLDEYADMKPNVWEEIIRPALMDVEGAALFIGTPKGKNHFYELFQQAFFDKTGEMEAFSFSTRDNPTLSAREKDRLYTDAKYSSDLRRQELDASFITRNAGYLKEQWWQFSQEEPADGYFVVAVDLAGFKPNDGKTKTRDDEHAIAVVKITAKGWWVKEIRHGHWGTRECALQIILAARDCGASVVGIEKTSLFYAVHPYIQDVMQQYGQFYHIEPLAHGNQRKQDRILWALQGRLERGRVTLNADAASDLSDKPVWVQRLLDQASDFPSSLSKDDLVDALAYTDQLGKTVYTTSFEGSDEWTPLDEHAGY